MAIPDKCFAEGMHKLWTAIIHQALIDAFEGNETAKVWLTEFAPDIAKRVDYDNREQYNAVQNYRKLREGES